MVLVDLSTPPAWFSAAQAADHMDAAAARAFAGATGRVLLLTTPAVCGYVQNPISVYYCYDEGSSSCARAIAEVCCARQCGRAGRRSCQLCLQRA
jgi:DUF1365 family protein